MISGGSKGAEAVMFDRAELETILRVYGFMVAGGDWRDYAIDALKDRAEFAVFRHAAEMPIYRIVKTPAEARRQGAYKILAPTGAILKRGHDLKQVLKFFDRQLMRLAVNQ